VRPARVQIDLRRSESIAPGARQMTRGYTVCGVIQCSLAGSMGSNGRSIKVVFPNIGYRWMSVARQFTLTQLETL
jgi:hypothetical protein